VKELVSGLFHWTATHPRTGGEASSYYVAGSRSAIDPLLPEEGIEWFEGRGVERVILTNRHHLRHAEALAERFDCPILCNEAGLHEFERGPAVEGFAPGDALAADITALEMGAICPDDSVLHVDVDAGALAFADSLIHRGEIGFVSDRLIGDDPEGMKETARARARELLAEQRFDHLLFAHGDPLVGGGRDALRRFAESG
jgi:hypothetical protein